MSHNARQNLKMIAIAVAASVATAAAPAIAHGVEHALFAHQAGVANNAKKLGGKKPAAYLLKSSSLYERAHKRIKVVRSGGTATANGSAFRLAMSSITTASNASRWLLILEPGTYNLGSTPLRLKQFVDVQGSGRTSTVITCACATPGNSTAQQGATLFGVSASTAEPVTLSHLAVRNTGGSAFSHAVNFQDFGMVRMHHVDLSASGGTNNSVGLWLRQGSAVVTDSRAVGQGATINVGIDIGQSDLDLRDSLVEAHGPAGAAVGYGIQSNNGNGDHLRVTDSMIDASGVADMYIGITAAGGSVTIRGTEIAADGPAVSRGISLASMQAAEAGRVMDTIVRATGPGDNIGVLANVTPAVIVTNSYIRAGSDSAVHAGSSATLRVGQSELEGSPTTSGGGSLACFQNYTPALVAYSCA